MRNSLYILLIFMSISGFTQNNYVGLSLGYGEYEMDDMKNFQHTLAVSYRSPVVSEVVVSYPAKKYFGLTFGNQFNANQRLGLTYQFHNTGGRNSMSDYSGAYTLDLFLQQHTIGLTFSQRFFRGKIGPVAQFTGGASISYLILEERLRVFEEKAEYKNNFFGLTFHIEPAGGFYFNFNEYISAEVLMGYSFTGIASYRSTENPKLFLSSHYKKANTNWTGIRVFVTLYFKLPKKKAKTQ